MKDNFFLKLMLNWLKTYDFTFSDDMILRSIVTRLYSNRGMSEWIRLYNEKLEAWQEIPENKKEYVTPHKFLRPDDIEQFLAISRNSSTALDEPFPILPNTKVLAEVLELNETETLIFDLAMRLSGSIPYEYQVVLENFQYDSRELVGERLYASLLGVREEDIREAKKGFLFQSGMLVPCERTKVFVKIHADLADAFTKADLTLDSLAESLFPSNLKTDLSTDNYPHLTKEIARTEEIIRKGLENKTRGINVMLWGLPGTGKTELVLALAKKNNWNLRVIGDISDADNTEKSRAQRLTSLKVALKLYARDENTVLLFDEMEDLFKQDVNAQFSKAFINRIIETTPIPIIWTTNDLWSLGSAVLRRMVYNIGFEVPPKSARAQIWKNYTTKYGVELSEDTIEDLADTFDTVPALINNAVKITQMAKLPAEEVPEVLASLDKLMNYGMERKFKGEDRNLEEKYDPSCVNADLDMAELMEQLKHADPGFSLCLYGPPGTGKSEWARHMAKALGKKVLFKRASDLQSMWVGECEKNIARAFKQAKDEEKVLIIDEGDTFLQDRQKAQRSWEVSQVNEMLSQMEVHTQPFVMTTNLMHDLDPASLRRFTFKLKFDYLRADQSRRLFKSFFDAEAPADLDRIEVLTPGDFANIRKKVRILKITDANKIYDLLMQEVDLKPGRKMSMGFR